MRISDWSSDVCSSDLLPWSGKRPRHGCSRAALAQTQSRGQLRPLVHTRRCRLRAPWQNQPRRSSMLSERASTRSEEHTSELQSLMRISYAVFCLKKKKQQNKTNTQHKTYTKLH